MRPEIQELIRILLEHKGKVTGIVLGFLIGLAVIVYGWVKALWLVGCIIAGYYIGKQIDSKKGVRDFFKRTSQDDE